MFYVNFKKSVTPNIIHSSGFYKVVFEILKANSFYSYSLIEQKNDYQIMIRWSSATKKAVIKIWQRGYFLGSL